MEGTLQQCPVKLNKNMNYNNQTFTNRLSKEISNCTIFLSFHESACSVNSSSLPTNTRKSENTVLHATLMLMIDTINFCQQNAMFSKENEQH